MTAHTDKQGSAEPLRDEVMQWRGLKATPTAVPGDYIVVGNEMEKALIEETARRRRAEILLAATQQAYVRDHEALSNTRSAGVSILTEREKWQAGIDAARTYLAGSTFGERESPTVNGCLALLKSLRENTLWGPPADTRSASVSSEDAACKVAADLLRNEIVRLEYPKSMFPQEAEKIRRRQTAFQEAVRYLDSPDRCVQPK